LPYIVLILPSFFKKGTHSAVSIFFPRLNVWCGAGLLFLFSFFSSLPQDQSTLSFCFLDRSVTYWKSLFFTPSVPLAHNVWSQRRQSVFFPIFKEGTPPIFAPGLPSRTLIWVLFHPPPPLYPAPPHHLGRSSSPALSPPLGLLDSVPSFFEDFRHFFSCLEMTRRKTRARAVLEPLRPQAASLPHVLSSLTRKAPG